MQVPEISGVQALRIGRQGRRPTIKHATPQEVTMPPRTKTEIRMYFEGKAAQKSDKMESFVKAIVGTYRKEPT